MSTQSKSTCLSRHFVAAACVVSMLITFTADAAPTSVPGTSDLWLAGMPDGATASSGDIAPSQSPVLVSGILVLPGSAYSWLGSGQVRHGPTQPFFGPDGNAGMIVPHYAGAENGIGNLVSPVDSLIGVFLGPDQPNIGGAPTNLDFSNIASRDYVLLAPALKQPFFMGDGLASGSMVQQVIAPPGASRLFLGTMDGQGWYNNEGSFSVEVVRVQVIPAPSAVLLGTMGVGGLNWLRKRRAI